MTRRVVYVSPGASGIYDAHYRNVLREAALPGTEVDVVHLPLEEEDDSPFLSEYPFYHSEMFKTIKQAEDDGYHAAIIGCSADPGLLEARRMVDMPVTGPLEANLHLASMLRNQRVTILVPGKPAERVLYTELARLYGLEHVISSIIPVDLKYPPADELSRLMREDQGALCEIILECHRRFLDEEAFALTRTPIVEKCVGAIYFGCTLWTGMLDDIAGRLEVPVLDPGIGALRVAEMLADRTMNAGRRPRHSVQDAQPVTV